MKQVALIAMCVQMLAVVAEYTVSTNLAKHVLRRAEGGAVGDLSDDPEVIEANRLGPLLMATALVATAVLYLDLIAWFLS